VKHKIGSYIGVKHKIGSYIGVKHKIGSYGGVKHKIGSYIGVKHKIGSYIGVKHKTSHESRQFGYLKTLCHYLYNLHTSPVIAVGHGSSVNVVNILRATRSNIWGLIPDGGEDFSLRHSVLTGCRTRDITRYKGT
jgi:hypothetical protein